MVLTREREFKTAEDFIRYMLSEENVHIVKVGKNIKESICNEYLLLEIDEFLNNLDEYFAENADNHSMDDIGDVNDQIIGDNIFDYLNSLDDFLNPGQYLKR